MELDPSRRTGVMIVRAWREPEHPRPLRARLISTFDVVSAKADVEMAKSVDEVCDAVRTWLEEILREQ
ncbi:MAG TPA: hypothetical protein VF729_08480 [Solirubrobacterales bacterium]